MVLKAASTALVESFVSKGNAENRREAYMDFVATIFTFIIAIVILGFVGKYLWNAVVVDLFSFAKPVRSVWQILGLVLFLALVSP